MEELIATNGRFVKDGVSSAKFIGVSNGKVIKMYNCHLGLPPFGGFHVPCLYGTMEDLRNNVYHYKNAFITSLGGKQYRIIIR